MKIHGMSYKKIYKVWSYMLTRCHNENCKAYPNYGARGITVCERWQIFANFYADMGEAPDGMTLDRIDNDKGYNKRNCRWVSRAEQLKNTRRSVYLEYNGERLPMCDWARRLGINKNTLSSRIRNGWSVAEALST